MTDSIMNQETEPKRKTYQRTYMKDYMGKKYKANPEEENAKKKTNRAIKKFNPSKEECEKFGIYLGHFVKLREIATFLKSKKEEELREFFNEFM